MTSYRIEKDFLGEVKVPASAYYGGQTQRASENFPISSRRMPREFVRAMGIIKRAAAEANMSLGLLDTKIGKAPTGLLSFWEGRSEARLRYTPMTT